MVTKAQLKSQKTIRRYAERRRERDKPRYVSPPVTVVTKIEPQKVQYVTPTGEPAEAKPRVIAQPVETIQRQVVQPTPSPLRPQVQQPTQQVMEAGAKPTAQVVPLPTAGTMVQVGTTPVGPGPRISLITGKTIIAEPIRKDPDTLEQIREKQARISEELTGLAAKKIPVSEAYQAFKQLPSLFTAITTKDFTKVTPETIAGAKRLGEEPSLWFKAGKGTAQLTGLEIKKRWKYEIPKEIKEKGFGQAVIAEPLTEVIFGKGEPLESPLLAATTFAPYYFTKEIIARPRATIIEAGAFAVVGGVVAGGVAKAPRRAPITFTTIKPITKAKPRMIGFGVEEISTVARRAFVKGEVLRIQPTRLFPSKRMPKVETFDFFGPTEKLGFKTPRGVETTGRAELLIKAPTKQKFLAEIETVGIERPTAKGFIAEERVSALFEVKKPFFGKPKLKETKGLVKTTGELALEVRPEMPLRLEIPYRPHEVRLTAKGVDVIRVGEKPVQIFETGRKLFKIDVRTELGKARRVRKLPEPFIEIVKRKPEKLKYATVGEGFVRVGPGRRVKVLPSPLSRPQVSEVTKFAFDVSELSVRPKKLVLKPPKFVEPIKRLVKIPKSKRGELLLERPRLKPLEKIPTKVSKLAQADSQFVGPTRIRTGFEGVRVGVRAAVEGLARPKIRFIPRIGALSISALRGAQALRAETELLTGVAPRLAERGLLQPRVISRTLLGTRATTAQLSVQRSLQRGGLGIPSLAIPTPPPVMPGAFLLLGGPWLPRWGAKKPSVTRPRPFAYVPSITAFEFGIVGKPLEIGKRGFLTGLAIRPLAKKVELPKFDMRGY